MDNKLLQAMMVMERERECVLRQDTSDCDKDCKNCNLLLPTETVVEGYDTAIEVIKAINTIDAIMRPIDNQDNVI